jgi:hypothetical protein
VCDPCSIETFFLPDGLPPLTAEAAPLAPHRRLAVGPPSPLTSSTPIDYESPPKPPTLTSTPPPPSDANLKPGTASALQPPHALGSATGLHRRRPESKSPITSPTPPRTSSLHAAGSRASVAARRGHTLALRVSNQQMPTLTEHCVPVQFQSL